MEIHNEFVEVPCWPLIYLLPCEHRESWLQIKQVEIGALRIQLNDFVRFAVRHEAILKAWVADVFASASCSEAFPVEEVDCYCSSVLALRAEWCKFPSIAIQWVFEVRGWPASPMVFPGVRR